MVDRQTSLDTLALSLVRAHYDDEMNFDAHVRSLAEFYHAQGDVSKAEYCLAMLPGYPTIGTMEVDPLPTVARDLYDTVENVLGPNSEEAKWFRIRLSCFFPDFLIRCRREGSVTWHEHGQGQ